MDTQQASKLVPANACIAYLDSLLADRGLLSPSTSVILESICKHISGSSPKEHYSMAIGVIKTVVIEEMQGITDSAALYFAEKMVDRMKKENVF
jgi:hypothetical protein